jgi:hypothetical protein
MEKNDALTRDRSRHGWALRSGSPAGAGSTALQQPERRIPLKKKTLIVWTTLAALGLLLVLPAVSAAFTAQRIVIPYTVTTDKWWSGLAIHNESDSAETYSVSFYAEDGTFIAGDCVTVQPRAMVRDALPAFASDPEMIDGAASVYIRTTGASDDTFSATLFVGNTAESQGFAFQSYRSEDYEAFAVILCDIILPTLPGGGS